MLIVVCIIAALVILIICIIYYTSTVFTGSTYFTCNPGQCATNKYNGEKRCPELEKDKVFYDSSFETCNSRYTCESKFTPYALLPNGSTNSMGICAPGNICRCLDSARCATDIVSIFQITNGNINNNRTVFNQISLDIQGNDGSQVFDISDPNTTFCGIKANHLNKITPGACTFTNPENIDLNELTICMRSNPCLVGVLAFNPNDIDTFVLNKSNTTAIYNVPVSCMSSQGNPNTPNSLKNYCDSLSVPVWNNKIGVVECHMVTSLGF